MTIALSAEETPSANYIIALIDFKDGLPLADDKVSFHESKSYLDKEFNQVYATEKFQIGWVGI